MNEINVVKKTKLRSFSVTNTKIDYSVANVETGNDRRGMNELSSGCSTKNPESFTKRIISDRYNELSSGCSVRNSKSLQRKNELSSGCSVRNSESFHTNPSEICCPKCDANF